MLTQLRNILSTTVQWELTLVFSWQHSTVVYCWQLHASYNQYNG